MCREYIVILKIILQYDERCKYVAFENVSLVVFYFVIRTKLFQDVAIKLSKCCEKC